MFNYIYIYIIQAVAKRDASNKMAVVLKVRNINNVTRIHAIDRKSTWDRSSFSSAGGCGADYAQHECSRGIEGKGALTYLSIVPVAFSPGTNMPAGYEGRELPLVHRFRLPFADMDGIKVPERAARSEAKCMYGSPSVAGSYCWPTLHSKSRSEIKQQTRL